MPRPISSGGRLQRRLAEFDGGPASYLSVGRGGIPALLLHGFAGDLLTWQFNLSAIAADRRAVAVDLPGHGSSTPEFGDGLVSGFAPWLLRFLDRLEIPAVHLVGHSMGGLVARELAGIAPERVASLTLIAGAGIGAAFDLDFLGRVAAPATLQEAADCVDRLFARPSPLAGRIAEVLFAQAADAARSRARSRIVQSSFIRFAEGWPPLDWSRYRMPIQVIWGREDRVIPLPPADRLPPGAAFHVFDNAGHLPHTEVAGPVTAVIRSFLSACDLP